jgi:hypothetical protein
MGFIRPVLLFIFATFIIFENSHAESPNSTKKINKKPKNKNCLIENPLKYHLKKTAEGRRDESVQTLLDLNDDGRIDILQSAQDQCGSAGCEYSILLNLGSSCYQDIGEVRGQLKWLPTVENGFHQLEYSTRGDALTAPVQKILKYNPKSKRYEDATESK